MKTNPYMIQPEWRNEALYVGQVQIGKFWSIPRSDALCLVYIAQNIIGQRITVDTIPEAMDWVENTTHAIMETRE